MADGSKLQVTSPKIMTENDSSTAQHDTFLGMDGWEGRWMAKRQRSSPFKTDSRTST